MKNSEKLKECHSEPCNRCVGHYCNIDKSGVFSSANLYSDDFLYSKIFYEKDMYGYINYEKD